MSEIKKAFRSRYPKGRILELDFSQLEIYVLAVLSNDATLKSDLASGKDLHGISAEMLFGSTFTPAQRKIAKQLSFQLQYGAGAKSMAETNGIAIEVAKKFIENYYSRYTGVKAYHDSLLAEVDYLRETRTGLRTQKGNPAGVSKMHSLTGRTYTFIEQDAPDFLKVATSFSPTKTKNYPVQGFATGDIVPMCLGKIFRALRSNLTFDRAIRLVNTIHDSVMFDCKDEASALAWAAECKAIMENAPHDLKAIFGIDFDLPLHAGVEMGESWFDMKEVA